jgi:hypothetical membrane protein
MTGTAGRTPDALRRVVRRVLLWGGILGPAAFVAAWAILGATTSGYSPVHDAISRLGAARAPTRPAMTAGFVAYGTGLVLFGVALRPRLPGPAWISAVITGVAAWGVAAFPLGSSVDSVHNACAVLGYLSLAAIPMLAAPPLARNNGRRRARWSVAVGLVAGACLLATAYDPLHGLSQRAGLTVADMWVAALAIDLLVGRPDAPASGPPSDGATNSGARSGWAPGRRTGTFES